MKNQPNQPDQPQTTSNVFKAAGVLFQTGKKVVKSIKEGAATFTDQLSGAATVVKGVAQVTAQDIAQEVNNIIVGPEEQLRKLKLDVSLGELGNINKFKDNLKDLIAKDENGELIKNALGYNANPEIVKLLVENGVKVDKVWEAILETKATNENQVKAYKVLFGEDVDGVYLDDEHKQSTKQSLIESMKDKKDKFLPELIKVSSIDVVRELLPHCIELGADPNGKIGEDLEEKTPLVALVEKWNEDGNKSAKGVKEKYMNLAKELVLNGALANEKVQRTYEGNKIAGATALDIMSNEDAQSQNFDEFKDVLRLAQSELGQKIRENRMERIKVALKKVGNTFKSKESKLEIKEVSSNRDVLRKRQKSIGQAIRGSR